jgi:glutathionyl-hydroquinone reductase
LAAHAYTVTTLNDGYEEIKKSLDALLNETNQSSETRLIAQSLRKKVDELETTFSTVFLE